VTLPPDIAEAMRGRPAGRVWLTVIDRGGASTFDELAVAAGLEPLGDGWQEVNAERARSILKSILHRDQVYGVELIPEAQADVLAGEFVRFLGQTARFAVNSPNWMERGSFLWAPATDYTFDAGVAVVSETGAAIYWVADED
jgi:hypothetical protein